MINELENKIRKAIPELLNLGDGSIIYKPHYNFFKQEFVENQFEELTYFKGSFYDDDCNIIPDKHINDDWLCSKPIQLNHVLEYVETIYPNTFTSKAISLLRFWNLKSNLLSDQSEELIKYINEL